MANFTIKLPDLIKLWLDDFTKGASGSNAKTFEPLVRDKVGGGSDQQGLV